MTTGGETLAFHAGDSLLITADVPIVSQVTRASPAEPYLSLVLELDPSTIADLSVEMRSAPAAETAPVRVEPTDSEVVDAALRLMRLLDRPGSLPILHGQLVRELHYWLLEGSHGAGIRRLGLPEGPHRRIGRAVAVLRSEYARSLRVERLAVIAGMSPSSLHQHFRAVTSLSPLQFQKQLRLIEARRLMLAEGLTASSAAFAVGYESASQFTREYGRLFGLPPSRDTNAVRERAETPVSHGIGATSPGSIAAG